LKEKKEKDFVMMWVSPEFKKKMHIERAEKGYPSIIAYTKSLSQKPVMFEKTIVTGKKYKKNEKKQKKFSFF